MSPLRIVEQYPRSFAAQLLRAGRAVKAPEATLEVTLTALGVGATAATTVSRFAHGRAWAWVGTASAKTIGAAILAASGVFLAMHLAGMVRPPSPAKIERAVTPATARVAPYDAPAQTQRERAAVTTSNANAPPQTKAVEILPAPVAAPKVKAPSLHDKTPPAAAASTESLGAEVALIDEARRAMDEGRVGPAMVLLQQYDRQFTRPRLAREAALLRARALEELARDSEAKATSVTSGSETEQKQPSESQR